MLLADGLRRARRSGFVGRSAEIALVRGALRQGWPDGLALVWFHGPGGMGKTTLLQRLADEAAELGVPVAFLDLSTLEPSPDAVAAAVTASLEGNGTLDGTPPVRSLLLLDTVEVARPIETRLRTEVLPALPAGTLVVLAGRLAPDSRWTTDLGWAERMRACRLGSLADDDARSYLARRGLAGPELEDVVSRAHGHPLALALLCDVHRQAGAVSGVGGMGGDDARTVLAALVERFRADVPDPAHRTALAVLTHARFTTEELLRGAVGADRAAECFAWLGTLSFVELHTEGLAPHALARDVLDDDLRWRDREVWTATRRAVRDHCAARVLEAAGAEQERATAGLMWLHRRSPLLRTYASWHDAFALWAEPAQPEDLPAVLALVARHEGDASARIHAAWWGRRPEDLWVLRSGEADVHGCVLQLRLDVDGVPDGGTLAEEVGDPVAQAAWGLVREHAPLRAGEHLRVLRSWFGPDGYQRPTATHQAVIGLLTRRWLTEPGLAVSVSYAVGAELWTPLFGYADYARAEAGDCRLGDVVHTAYLHDWRVAPALEWLRLLGDRDAPDPAAPDAPDPVRHAARHLGAGGHAVLSQERFAAAVREALRCANRPAELASSPLLGSRVVGRGVGAAELRALLAEAVAELARDGRRSDAARAVEVTYLLATRTQAAAAARLALPFGTYRRRLAAGVAGVVDLLWARELRG